MIQKKKKKSNKTLKTVGEGRRGLLKQNYARIKKVENLFQSTSKKLFGGTPETSCLQRREVSLFAKQSVEPDLGYYNSGLYCFPYQDLNT